MPIAKSRDTAAVSSALIVNEHAQEEGGVSAGLQGGLV